MQGYNYRFLFCIQVSQGTGKVVWYYHLFKNFPQFAVIRTVKGFGLSENNAQLWMWLVMEVKSDAVKSSIA